MDFENDPAADFLSREREELAGIINENEGELDKCNKFRIFSYQNFVNHRLSEPMFNPDEFELINSEIQQADAQANELIDDLAGMSFQSTIPEKVDEVPEKILLWRENFSKSLEEKDERVSFETSCETTKADNYLPGTT